MKLKVVPILAAFFVCWQAALAPAATNFVSLTYTQAPVNNPLKGFMPYQGSYSTFPYSMEWNYLPLRPIMTGPTTFSWSTVESLLNDVASRGHQTVLRIYLDYPTETTGIPQFLLNDGLAFYDYTDEGNTSCSGYTDSNLSECSGSVCPDYTNLNLQEALTNFIAAFGAQYDGDPRIGYITVGLLGAWGEWHSYPTADFASTAVQQEVLTAYQAAFHKTKLQVRYPDSTTAAYPIGFHDDSFDYDTLPSVSDSFYGGEQGAGLTGIWQTQAIGGEVYPPIQSCMWDNGCSGALSFSSCVTTTHATWLLNNQAFSPGYTGSDLTACTAGAHLMGYELFVPSATLADAQLSGPLNVSLQITNTGVAPFYYNWPVELKVLNSSDQTVQTWTTSWQLSTLQPGTSYPLSFTQTNHGLALGQYKLLMGVPNPMSGGLVFDFANQTQNSDLNGWLTLGTFNVVTNSTTSTNLASPTLGFASNNVVALENAGAVTVPGFATMTTAAGLSITNVAILSNSDGALFAAGPAVSTSGTLTFTPATGAIGGANVTVQAQDNGGIANGRTNGSTAQTFSITVQSTNAASTNITLTVDPTQTWNGGLNYYTTGGGYVGYESYTLAQLPATFIPSQNSSATRLLLGINTATYALNSAWDDGSGNPLRDLETDSYIQSANYGGDMVTFVGTVESNTIPTSSWTVYAVIKEYVTANNNFLTPVTTVLSTSGAFSVSRNVAVGDTIQYGFYVYGPNTAPGSANSQQMASLIIGSGATVNPVTITATPNGTSVNLSIPTQNGITYTVQYKNHLTDASWQTLTTINGDGSVHSATDPFGASGATRYYRVMY